MRINGRITAPGATVINLIAGGFDSLRIVHGFAQPQAGGAVERPILSRPVTTTRIFFIVDR